MTAPPATDGIGQVLVKVTEVAGAVNVVNQKLDDMLALNHEQRIRGIEIRLAQMWWRVGVPAVGGSGLVGGIVGWLTHHLHP